MQSEITPIGGLDPAHSLAEQLELPVLDHVGAVAVCRQALDAAATARRGVLVVGDKGTGKSVGAQKAMAFFSDLERGRKGLDGTYRPRRILQTPPLTRCSYRETGIILGRALSKRFTDRLRGKKKADAEIRAEVVQLCRTQRYAALLVDEAETCTDDTLLFLRDLMSGVEGEDRKNAQFASQAAGIGVVVIGDRTLEGRLEPNVEAMHRWAMKFDVPSPTVAVVDQLLHAWFPAFQKHTETVGQLEWHNFLMSAFSAVGGPNLRVAENTARVYALHVTRRDRSISNQAQIPFIRTLFEKALEETTWAAPKAVDASSRAQKVRLGRRSA